MELIIGTRGSQLAVAQSRWVADLIEKQCPGVKTRLKIVTTKGDTILHLPLHQIGGKGLFTETIEAALLSGEVDLAVHSMKDMPSEMDAALSFACVPERQDPRDVMVFRSGIHTFDELPKAAKIGCGSLRRICQLRAMRPDLKLCPIRGNIDTRLRKIDDEGLDGVVLAAAGLRRLGLENRIGWSFPVEKMVPACAQGALGLEIRSDRQELKQLLSPLSDRTAELQISAERSYLAAVGGGCHLPVGAYCHVIPGGLELMGLLGTEDGSCFSVHTVSGQEKEAVQLGIRLAEEIRGRLEDARNNEK